MKIRVFTPNEKGKIELTRAELEKLLNEVYAEGQNDCNCSHFTWPNPYTPYISCNDSTTTNASTRGAPATATIALNNANANADVKEMSKHIKDAITTTATAKPSYCVEDFITKLAKELNF